MRSRSSLRSPGRLVVNEGVAAVFPAQRVTGTDVMNVYYS
jgi:hypothetical protein